MSEDVLTPVSYDGSEKATCNCCGEPITDKNEYGLVVEARGGYNSTELRDCNTYRFEVCEPCLVGFMNTFKVPPTVYEDGGEPIEWKDERAQLAAYRELQRKQKEAHEAAVAAGVCTDREAFGDKCCGGPKAGLVNGNPTCYLHLVDAYALSSTQTYVVVETDEGTLTAKDIHTAGLKFIDAWRHRIPGLVLAAPTEHHRQIWISTLFSLLFESRDAAHWLEHLTKITPARALEWHHHSIPNAFEPHRIQEAILVNDWLAWGKLAGYDNAVAHPLVHRHPDRAGSMWRELTPEGELSPSGGCP